MLKKICDLIEQFIFKSIVKKRRVENFKFIEYRNHRKNTKKTLICWTIECNFDKFSNTMNKFNIKCWCKISSKNFCRFWCDDIEFNTETKKTKLFVIETNMIFLMFSTKLNNCNIESCRNIERKYKKCYQFHHKCWRIETDLQNRQM